MLTPRDTGLPSQDLTSQLHCQPWPLCDLWSTLSYLPVPVLRENKCKVSLRKMESLHFYLAFTPKQLGCGILDLEPALPQMLKSCPSLRNGCHFKDALYHSNGWALAGSFLSLWKLPWVLCVELGVLIGDLFFSTVALGTWWALTSRTVLSPLYSCYSV